MDKNRQSPPISIVICTYNRANVARNAIDSVLEQEFPADLYELLIVDNASTDNTRDMVEKYCHSFPNVRYLLEANVGLSHARNRGWQESQGEYVGYLDDDCKATQEWLARACEIAKTVHPDAFGGPYYAFYDVSKPEWFKDAYGSHVQGMVSRSLDDQEYLNGGNMFIRRDVLMELGGFQSDLGMQGKKIAYGEETYFFNQLRLKRKDVVLYYDPALFVHHLVRTEKLALRNAPKRFFLAGLYSGKVRESKRPGPIHWAVIFFTVMPSIFLTILKIFKSCTWDLLLRNRKEYPFYQNYLYEQSMLYFSKLGTQIQYILQRLGAN